MAADGLPSDVMRVGLACTPVVEVSSGAVPAQVNHGSFRAYMYVYMFACTPNGKFHVRNRWKPTPRVVAVYFCTNTV